MRATENFAEKFPPKRAKKFYLPERGAMFGAPSQPKNKQD